MALTKTSFYIGIPIFVLILIALQNFGNGLLVTHQSGLSSDSIDYISEYNSNMGGISDYSVSDSEVNATKGNPFDVYGEDKKTSAFEFGVVSFFKTKFNSAWDFIGRIFNLPTFLLNTLGLNLQGEFSFVVNAFITVLSFAGLIYAIKVVQGGA